MPIKPKDTFKLAGTNAGSPKQLPLRGRPPTSLQCCHSCAVPRNEKVLFDFDHVIWLCTLIGISHSLIYMVQCSSNTPKCSAREGTRGLIQIKDHTHLRSLVLQRDFETCRGTLHHKPLHSAAPEHISPPLTSPRSCPRAASPPPCLQSCSDLNGEAPRPCPAATGIQKGGRNVTLLPLI